MLLSRQDLTDCDFLSLISLFLFFPISFSISVSQPVWPPPFLQHTSSTRASSFHFTTHDSENKVSFIFLPTFLYLSFFLFSHSSTSLWWSPAEVGVSTCPIQFFSAAGWGERGRWQSVADQSFSGAAWQTVAESLGDWASAAAPMNGALFPEAARWASRSEGLDGLDRWQRWEQ